MVHLDRRLAFSIAGIAALAGCGGADRALSETRGTALAPALVASADTFINSAFPDNNDGTSPSLYTGQNGQKGVMRALVKWDLPPAWHGHVTITRVVLTMITRGTGIGDAMPPTAATASLQAIAVPWTEGAGFGDGSMSNTVGQACGTTGATWNQPDCAGGTPWTGGAAATLVSGAAAVPAALEAAVTWDSDAAGNAGMLADVQSWIDTPADNQGWRIASTTEATAGQAQRFYAREVAGKGPTLTVTAACSAGLMETDGGCQPASSGTDAATGSSDATTTAPDAGGAGGIGNGGCSCEVQGQAAVEPAALLLALAALILARRRRSFANATPPSPWADVRSSDGSVTDS